MQTVLDNQRSFCFRMPRIAPYGGELHGRGADTPALRYPIGPGRLYRNAAETFDAFVAKYPFDPRAPECIII